MLHVTRWLVPVLLPALFLLGVVFRTDRNREPLRIVLGTFALGAICGLLFLFAERTIARFSDMDDTEGAGILFLFSVVGPIREASKVLATWPAFRSKHFDEPYDGLVYSASAALGFAVVEGIVLAPSESGVVALLRILLALPANLFFAATWGYALGRAKQMAGSRFLFPATWLIATLAHALFLFLLYNPHESALLGTLPLLVAMGGMTLAVGKDLRARTSRRERSSYLSLTGLPAVPSFDAVRKSLRRTDAPIRFRWIVLGTLVTLGAMMFGAVTAVLFGRWAHVDFSIVNENDISTAAPLLLLAVGLLGSFALSGYLIARASRLPSLLEPALASACAIVLTLLGLGFTVRVGLLLGLSCAPVAWLFACGGAWLGRVPPESSVG
jgi:RsiW-degrading membrane proteinase PrsW (M82 family)